MGDEASEMGDNLPVVDLGTNLMAKSLALGSNFACAILSNDAVKCWGGNGDGQLGYGDKNDRGDDEGEMGDNLPVVDLGTGFTAKALVAKGSHVCALLNNDQVKCWGRNDSCQLGQVHQNHLGDEVDEMGDNLPPIDLGAGLTAKTLALGAFHSCALLNNGQVKCWGRNNAGQSGQGHRLYFVSRMGDELPVVDFGTDLTAKTLVSGAQHTCALLNDGQVKCWGHNGDGQLGLGVTERYIGDEEDETGDQLPAVNLGTGVTVNSLVAASYYNCALLNDDQVKCWGLNSDGQLGQESTEYRVGDESSEVGDGLPVVDLGT